MLIWIVFTGIGMIVAAAVGWAIGGVSGKFAMATERLIMEARG